MSAGNFGLKYKIVSVLHITVATILEESLFNVNNLHSNGYYIAFKLISIIAIFTIWRGVFYAAEQSMAGNKWFQCFIKHLCIYGAVMLIVFLVLYPGTLYGDHYRMIERSLKLVISINVTYILSYIYILSYMIIPFVTGPVIALAALSVAVAAYIIACVEMICAESCSSQESVVKGERKAYILYIFFLFPSVLYNNVHPHRLQFYSWIYLFLFSSVIFTKLLRKPVNGKRLCMWGVLTGLLSMMRTEGCYLLICIPLLLIILYSVPVCGKRRIFTFVLISVVSFASFTIPEKLYEAKNGPLWRAGRDLPLTLSPMSIMLKTPEKYGLSEQDLSDIDKVASVDGLLKNASYFNYPVAKEYKREFTMEDYNKYMDIYLRTVMRHIPAYVGIKWKTFLAASAIGDERISYCTCTPHKSYIEKFPGLEPVNRELRSAVTAFMEGHKIGDNKTSTWLYPIFYNVLLAGVLQGIALIWGIRRKNKEISFLSGMFYLHGILVFLTATCSRFKHYYPVYLCGYVLTFCLIIFYWDYQTKHKAGFKGGGNIVKQVEKQQSYFPGG